MYIAGRKKGEMEYEERKNNSTYLYIYVEEWNKYLRNGGKESWDKERIEDSETNKEEEKETSLDTEEGKEEEIG